jgi:Fe-S-cluster containining protein
MGKDDVILKTLDGSEHRFRLNKAPLPIECFRCGICCTCYQPLLKNEEIETIARRLGLSAGAFLTRYAQSTVIGYLLRQTEEGCVFLRWEGGTRANCSIHPFRPRVCRNWAPSLSRRECLEGLGRLKARGKILLAEELYSSREAIEQFYSLFSDEQ